MTYHVLSGTLNSTIPYSVNTVMGRGLLCFTLKQWVQLQLVEYQTRIREVAGSTHTRSTASNLEQVANLLCAQANSASYPQWDGK